MIRSLAVIAAALAAAPLAAQEAPAWIGVWEGRVGTLPVRACLDSYPDGPGRGSYYYLSRLEPIALHEAGAEGGWIEQAPGSEITGTWEFAELSATRMRGTWRQGRRRLPFDLAPVPWTEGDWGGPCSSEAYLAPRLGAGSEVRREPGRLGDFAFVRHAFVPPGHFRDDVTIETFQFEPERPGDPAILAALRDRLPGGTLADPFANCFAGAISAHGTDGYFAEFLEPVMATEAFLVVRESSETYCGGAHPNAGYRHLAFDRQSGAELDLYTWLDGEAREHHPAADPADSYFTVLPALRAVIVARDPVDEPAAAEGEETVYRAECGDLVRDQSFWSLGLDRAGMLFVPHVPHVAGPCAATFVVPWDELQPFLSDEGRAGVARLRG